MGEADRLTIASGIPGRDLMENAGKHVADAAAEMAGEGARVLVLCGPGNNGGDGFVAARLLKQAGFAVEVALLKDPESLGGDARLAFLDMISGEGGLVPVLIGEINLGSRLAAADLVIDALLGAGLDRELSRPLAEIVKDINASGRKVLSVDLPTGINGATGEVMGTAVRAARSVTFFRLKPGHLLYPGRACCGDPVCGDIGIGPDVLDTVRPDTFLNCPALWRSNWQPPQAEGHKYSRGHAVVFGGPVRSTGASRLSAGAALRAGAGLVTLACPPSALLVYASHLTAVMVRPVSGAEEIGALLSDRRLNAVLIGPGYGVGAPTRDAVGEILKHECAAVLDADALTSFEKEPQDLFLLIGEREQPVVMTPHGGEFARLFPDLADVDRLTAARLAATRSRAVIVLKGADTVIAAPDGRAAINANASPWLATAGSGDVLSGIICACLAQSVPPFEAAAMGVWLHSEAGNEAGAALTAEDLVPSLKPVIARLVEKTTSADDEKTSFSL
ncbi:NAD(P)H-hydrate dehydratase [Roseibium aggregatum]|uniref:Bifunctional NAD(P)H-hydrate repair enzyme n=1 Tax=Roseibium aggregatum TaxID=187304 RepID=A0A926P425_9HYPH|nr:NAD(P)H-hydrate dehydratase [Roseibium aggregatum]MBD1548908.1 NAD(P)H-hydrate dehydratase [Roseibium aggregatum]